MKYELLDVTKFQHKKIVVPDIINFVWVGDANQANMEYIDIWKKTNKDKKIYLWCDENTSLCNLLHDSIREYVFSTDLKNKSDAELCLKNDAFNFIFTKLLKGGFFDELVVEFLSKYNIPHHLIKGSALNSRVDKSGIVIKKIADLFCCEFSDFMRFYYYEIILRCNLASASDIVRLLIIYQHGGIYIDVDTLPYTDNIFTRLNQFLEKEKIVEDDYLLLFKTKCILKKLSLLDFADNEYVNHHKDVIGTEKNKHQKIQELIELDVAEFSLRNVLPLGKMYVHKNLLAIGSLRRLKGIYFNNFMSSHPCSKAVRIILHTMKKRYRFLEKNNCIFDCYKSDRKASYLSRILTWRTELITKDYCVTSVLTGPGLIIEVLLGLAYELLDLESLEPSSVAEYFQNDKYGIALFQHNLDTPEGLHSSWRK